MHPLHSFLSIQCKNEDFSIDIMDIKISTIGRFQFPLSNRCLEYNIKPLCLPSFRVSELSPTPEPPLSFAYYIPTFQIFRIDELLF